MILPVIFCYQDKNVSCKDQWIYNTIYYLDLDTSKIYNSRKEYMYCDEKDGYITDHNDIKIGSPEHIENNNFIYYKNSSIYSGLLDIRKPNNAILCSIRPNSLPCVFKGLWNSTSFYDKNDGVVYRNVIFVANEVVDLNIVPYIRSSKWKNLDEIFIHKKIQVKWTSNKEYDVGDFCIHNRSLYICTRKTKSQNFIVDKNVWCYSDFALEDENKNFSFICSTIFNIVVYLSLVLFCFTINRLFIK